jgi:hypothetical protein
MHSGMNSQADPHRESHHASLGVGEPITRIFFGSLAPACPRQPLGWLGRHLRWVPVILLARIFFIIFELACREASA